MNGFNRNLYIMPGVSKRPTITDVARLCGVTPATVSRVLNKKKKFSTSDAVREKITETARKLGYVPDLAARNLNRGATHIVGVFASPRTHIAEGINESLLEGIASVLHPQGYDVFFELSSNENLGHAIPSWRFDGAILMQMPKPETIVELDRRHVPYVCVNEKVGKPQASILADDVMGANRALEHLVQLGHKRIAYANAQATYFDHYSVTDRYETLLAGVRKHSLHFVEGHETPFPSADDFLQRSIVEGRGTAVITYDHHIAVMILGAAQRQGLRIPQDFSLICFNDVFPVAMLPPPLTAVAVSGREMGRIGADLLLNGIQKPTTGAGKTIRVPEYLIVRASTAAPRVDSALGLPAFNRG
jgi:LacI family transcriptional regulator